MVAELKQFFESIDSETKFELMHILQDTSEGAIDVDVAVFSNLPEEGNVTGFTCGLSTVANPEWRQARPELMLTVDAAVASTWMLALGDLVARHACTSRFELGHVLDFGEQIDDRSAIRHFLIFPNTLLDSGSDLVTTSLGYKVRFSELLPIFVSEIPLLRSRGMMSFVHDFGIRFSDVYRQPIQ
jgi:hypothetical protein